MSLGRDESKHISCEYDGREELCPKNCEKCAIGIKTDADFALTANNLEEAIRLYKKAVFIEPKFAEAWCNLGNALGMMSDYKNAINAFDKALAIDPVYGKAMFGKAISLRNKGKVNEASQLANTILKMYEDQNVRRFIEELASINTPIVRTLGQALEDINYAAYEAMEQNDLLDTNYNIGEEKGIIQESEFAKQIVQYYIKKYGASGFESVWKDSIFAAFYGAIFVMLLYYKNKNEFDNTSAFDYLSKYSDLEELDREVEEMLGISDDDNKIDEVWGLLATFLDYSVEVIRSVEPKEKEFIKPALIKAAECASMIGMTCAAKHHEDEPLEVYVVEAYEELEKYLGEWIAFCIEDWKVYKNREGGSGEEYSLIHIVKTYDRELDIWFVPMRHPDIALQIDDSSDLSWYDETHTIYGIVARNPKKEGTYMLLNAYTAPEE